MDFQYTMSEGTESVPNYGLLLAKVAGIPNHIVTKAMSIVQTLQIKDQKRAQNASASLASSKAENPNDWQAIYAVAHQLCCVRYSTLNDEEMREHLLAVKQDMK